MPDIRTRVETVDNAGNAIDAARLGNNFEKHFINTSDAGRELVVSITKIGDGNITNNTLLAAYRQLSVTPDVGTFAAIGTADGSDFVSGTTTVVFVRLQTTGTPVLTSVDGATLAVVATFQPRF